MANSFMDPKTVALLNLGAGLMQTGAPSYGPPKSFLGALGGAAPGALNSMFMAQQANDMSEYRRAQMEEMQRKANAPAPLMNVAPGGTLVDPSTRQPVFTAPAAQRGPLVVGDALIDPANPAQPLYKAPPKPQAPTPLAQLLAEREALPQGDPRRATYDAAIGKATTAQPLANVDVKVNTKTGESLAGQVGNIATEGRATASGAIGIVDTVGRVRSALEGGNINLGPGATIRNKADQVAEILGVGGESTAERLVNTRNTIRGLAQFTVGARKSLKGQGQVSDYEGKLLTRAESGEIDDFTVPELKDFLKVTEKLARQAHKEHKRIIGVMSNSKDESVRGLVDYFDVPDMPEAQTAPGPRIKRYNPATGRIE